jgi:hypothetical protein
MLVVVGGHSRNLGKTAVVAGLIRRFRDRRWTAIKITQYGHGMCTDGGGVCGCESQGEHPFTLSEEYEPNGTDSGRFLAAGARRSFWLRTRQGQLAGAAGTLERILAESPNAIVESNSVVELLRPDVFLMLVDIGCADFKPSSARLLDRADAFLVIERGINVPMWEEVSRGFWDGKPRFAIHPPDYVTAEVAAFVSSRFSTAGV